MTPPAESALATAIARCGAPFVTMEFDPFGDVQACCANALYPLGNVAHRTVDEIWKGARAELLRDAIGRGDPSLGCTICRHRVESHDAELPLAGYTAEVLSGGVPGWPSRLSFSLHNTCNLECIMCGADRSSKIRSRRSHLPPLPHAYGDAFFEQIVPYLDRCDLVDFVGGEPFLVKEHGRIWDLLIERDLHPQCGVTTNGTVWNDRVEQVLDRFDTDLRISIDGRTKETFEAVRVGADHGLVYANLDRFHAYAKERGTYLAINWSFVRQNWFEFADMLRWAEERQLPVNVMTVIEPDFGVQRMPTPDLEVVLASLRHDDVELRSALELNRGTWLRQLTAIESEVERRRTGTRRKPCMEPTDPEHVATVAASIVGIAASSSGPVSPEELAARRSTAVAELRRWETDNPSTPPGGMPFGVAAVDADGRLLAVDPGEALPLGDPAGLTDVRDLIDRLRTTFGGHLWLAEEVIEEHRVHHTLFFGREGRDKIGVIVRLCSFATDGGVEIVLARDDWFADDDGSASTPVRLSATRRSA